MRVYFLLILGNCQNNFFLFLIINKNFSKIKILQIYSKWLQIVIVIRDFLKIQ